MICYDLPSAWFITTAVCSQVPIGQLRLNVSENLVMFVVKCPRGTILIVTPNPFGIDFRLQVSVHLLTLGCSLFRITTLLIAPLLHQLLHWCCYITSVWCQCVFRCALFIVRLLYQLPMSRYMVVGAKFTAVFHNNPVAQSAKVYFECGTPASILASNPRLLRLVRLGRVAIEILYTVYTAVALQTVVQMTNVVQICSVYNVHKNRCSGMNITTQNRTVQ